MIAIHAEDTRGGLAGVLARGGLLVTADELEDIDRLTAWCVAVGGSEPGPYPVRPHGDRRNRLAQLYADLIAGGSRLAAESTGRPGEPAWRAAVLSIAANTADTRDPLDTLTLALATLFDAWSLEPAGGTDIELALAIADPMRPGAGETTIEVAAPAAMLTLRPGSLIPGLGVQALLTGAGWAAAVVRKTARAFTPLPAAAARRLVEEARARGSAHARHHVPRLDRLSGVEHAALRDASTVVILLHGLFSTDAGTFDGFIDRLRQADPMALGTVLEAHARDHAAAIVFGAGAKETIEERFRQHMAAALERNPAGMQAFVLQGDLAQRLAARVAVVGWPHDTLTSIRANAGELADLIDRVFAGMETPPRIAFVAHSRGGLVARATAAELLSSPSANRWRDALAAIVTFGTPHDGAALAEHDARGLATYLLLAQSTGRVASIGDVLTYLDARTAEGLENLKPVNAVTESREQSFVDRLYERERGLRDAGGHRRPPLIAVGGRLDEEGRGGWRKRIAGVLVDRWLDQPDHDLVVELDSSTSPRPLPDVTMTVMSSHFEYFTTMAATHDWVFDIALASIWSTVDLATALADISRGIAAPDKASFRIRLRSRTPPTNGPS